MEISNNTIVFIGITIKATYNPGKTHTENLGKEVIFTALYGLEKRTIAAIVEPTILFHLICCLPVWHIMIAWGGAARQSQSRHLETPEGTHHDPVQINQSELSVISNRTTTVDHT